MGLISTWSTFKELFCHQFLPGNYGDDMRQGLYDLKQGALSVTQFKLKFDEHIVYFPNWGESDKIEFFVRNLKDSIWFKVSAHSPKTLDEAYELAMNFEREVNSRMERNKSQQGKRSAKSNYPAKQSIKFAKFSKNFQPSQFQSSTKETRLQG